jgi:hypothetical protein
MHAQISPDNAYLRFFSLSPLTPEREAQRLEHLVSLARQRGRRSSVTSP